MPVRCYGTTKLLYLKYTDHMKINTDIKVIFNPKKQSSCPCIAIGMQQIRPRQSKSKCVLYIYQKTMFGVCFSRCAVAKKTKAIRGKTYDK